MNRKTLITIAVAATLSTALTATMSQPAIAAATSTSSTHKSSEKPGVKKIVKEDLGKISNDAMLTMRNIHEARLAIFNGEPEEAQTYIDAAATRISATEKDTVKYAVDTKQKTKPKDTYVAYDSTLVVADKYIQTAKKAKHIAKANKHLHQGDRKAAMEELKLANTDVSVNMYLVPVKFAQHEILDAEKLVDNGKYYQANLALKSIQDSVVVETVSSKEKPKSRTHS